MTGSGVIRQSSTIRVAGYAFGPNPPAISHFTTSLHFGQFRCSTGTSHAR
jgi:hypothetical protein